MTDEKPPLIFQNDAVDACTDENVFRKSREMPQNGRVNPAHHPLPKTDQNVFNQFRIRCGRDFSIKFE